ncbi:putative nuclease HARBI1 [Toxorhynchites rutilus septentrionalis]|uniref:putative nuclease HARBI1 n=1 Tax=Toxorhynchites rutilus septentrionalis TaxID=329112 RepID=UPI00247A1B70|nr:putative nuclease HARBI1 [Toxorhynchites rutilus septentrionalis]
MNVGVLIITNYVMQFPNTIESVVNVSLDGGVKPVNPVKAPIQSQGLIIALRFYALGSVQIAVADFAGICISSVCRIIRRVSFALAQLRSRFIKMPKTQHELHAASREFYSIAKFPRTIASIDCTHVKIQSPGGDHAENYRNRKSWFSINVQTVSSANLKILNIVARWPGASHDQHIFNNSSLKMQLERGDYGHFIIVGDSGYRNTKYLATPFLRCETAAENLYNESQIRTRNVVERSYGVWKRRFPVLSLGMRVIISTVQLIIVACAVLHNIAIDAKEEVPPPEIEGFEEMLAATVVPNASNLFKVPTSC